MPSKEPLERIEPIGGSEQGGKVDLSAKQNIDELSSAKFEDAVSKADASKIELRRSAAVAPDMTIAAANRQSLIDLASTKTIDVPKMAPISKDIENQATSLRAAIDRPRATLVDNKNLIIDPSSVTALNANIEHIDRSLQDAAHLTNKVEAGSALPTTDQPPMVRFLNFLTESDRRISTMLSDVQALDLEKKPLTPSKLLAIQVKLGFLQQELEFFTNTLNKALESTKTIMNVQI